MLVYSLPIDIPNLSNFIYVDAVARRELGDQDINRVALGMHMLRENHREVLQCIAFWSLSCFSEEDLPSDLIGFYLAVNKLNNPRTDSETWNWLSRVCNFRVDKEEAIDWSLKVFKEYPKFKQLWTDWGVPRLECNDPIDGYCGEGRRNWPNELQIISPEVDSREGKWWAYSYDMDGPIIPSNIEHIGFLLPFWFQ